MLSPGILYTTAALMALVPPHARRCVSSGPFRSGVAGSPRPAAGRMAAPPRPAADRLARAGRQRLGIGRHRGRRLGRVVWPLLHTGRDLTPPGRPEPPKANADRF